MTPNERYAIELRDLYIQERRRIYPEYQMDNGLYPLEFWKDAAAAFMAENLTSNQVMKSLMMQHYRPARFPNVEMLKTAKSSIVESARDCKTDDDQEIEITIGLMKSHFSYAKTVRPVLRVIMDDGLFYNVIFRYAMALEHGYMEVASGYEDAAKELLRRHPVYAKHLKLPKKFVESK